MSTTKDWRPEVSLKDSAFEMLAIIFDSSSTQDEVAMATSALVEIVSPEAMSAQLIVNDLGPWASAAMDDPEVCAELKAILQRVVELET